MFYKIITIKSGVETTGKCFLSYPPFCRTIFTSTVIAIYIYIVIMSEPTIELLLTASSMKNCPTKVVLRRLPPKLTEDDFLKIVAPFPPHSYFRFCMPDDSLEGLSLPRAYITFNDIESLFDFKERFDNYVFVDSEVRNHCRYQT